MRSQAIPAHHRTMAKANAWASDTTNTWQAYMLFFLNQVTAFLLGFDVMDSACRVLSQEFHGRKQMVHLKYKCSKQRAICSRTGEKLSLMQNGFLCCLLSLIFPFPSTLAATLRALVTGSAWARGNGLLAIKIDGRKDFVPGSPEGDLWAACSNISLFPPQTLLLMPHVVPRLGHMVEKNFYPSHTNIWFSTVLWVPSSLY